MPNDAVHDQISDAIARGEFQPNQRLVEVDLGARFGATRARIRTALVRLEQEGLVEVQPHRGARVRLISESEAVELYETRGVLEGLAARKAAEVAGDGDVSELRAIIARIGSSIEQGDLDDVSSANAELHAAIIRIGGRQTVRRLVDSLNAHLVRFQYRTIMHPDRPGRSLVEHAAIVEAIAARDPAAAEQLMRSHLEIVTTTLHRPIPSAAFD